MARDFVGGCGEKERGGGGGGMFVIGDWSRTKSKFKIGSETGAPTRIQVLELAILE